MFDKSLLYIDLIERELLSPDRGLYFLSFAKIRTVAKFNGGYFSYDEFVKITGLHKRTAKTHLIKMVFKGFIKLSKKGVYRIVPQPTILVSTYKKEHCILISDEKILSFSWRNIASLRSLFVESIISRNRGRRLEMKKSKKIKKDRLRTFDDDLLPNKDNQFKTRWDSFVALSYVKEMLGFSLSTISKYRTLQDVAKYEHNVQAYPNADMIILQDNIQERIKNLKGRHFIWENKLFLCECSTRKEVKEKGIEPTFTRVKKSHSKGRQYSSGNMLHKPCTLF